MIKKKLYYYGMQDTGVSIYIYLKHHDFRYLWWALVGHEMYILKKCSKEYSNNMIYQLAIFGGD